jgi:hypothetical protein
MLITSTAMRPPTITMAETFHGKDYRGWQVGTSTIATPLGQRPDDLLPLDTSSNLALAW